MKKPLYFVLLLAFFAFSFSSQAQADENTQALSNSEFTDLLKRSFKSNKNGQLLLSVSDVFVATVNADNVSFAAIINLDKLAEVSPEARQNIERFDSFLFFLDREQLTLTIIGEPVVRNGLFGLRDNFSIKLGPIPVSNATLRQLGLEVEKANITNLKLDGITLESIHLEQGAIHLLERK